MKRKLTIVSAVIIAAVLLSVGSFAFFTKENTAKNVITAGNIDFVINEVTDSGEAFPVTPVEIMPGDTVSKIVTAKNTSDHPLYLRIKLTKTVDDPSLEVGDRLTADINDTDWTEKEGFYYYNKAVAPGEETQPLFTEVYVDGITVGNEYLGKKFILKVDGYAVQSENNGTDVFTAAGWPEENTAIVEEN